MDTDSTRVGRLRWTAGRVRAHWRWGRTQGWRRLIEEDQLDPMERYRLLRSKARWRRVHGVVPGTAVPVLIVGLQRSGTNMLLHGLERAPESEVHNENDKATFDRFRLRGDDVLRATVDASRHRFVLFKPLCDSHRTPDLLRAASDGRSRAVWIYRDVDGRVRSSLAKFGDHNFEVLRRFADGAATPPMWQVGGLTDEDRALVRDLLAAGLDVASASALFWYLRNTLYFRLGLDRREDVHLTSYDSFVTDPVVTMEALCDFLDFPYRSELISHVTPRTSASVPPLELHPRVRELCTGLAKELDRRTWVRG